MNVTRRSSMSRRVAAGSNAATRTHVPPLSSTGSVSMFSPAVWKSGADTSATSPATRSWSIRTLIAFQVMLPWVRVAPLGDPVVPDVYMIMQGSSSATGRSSGASSAAASSSSYRPSRAMRSRTGVPPRTPSTSSACEGAWTSTDAPQSASW